MRIGVSIGISICPRDTSELPTLFKNADSALYRAKSSRRGGYCFFASSNEDVLLADLRRALAHEEIVLHYQPILGLKGKAVAGFEALMRWKHPSRGMVSPGVFIPIAESSGLIVELGNWALQQACEDARQWPSGTTVSVNLSPHQLEACDVYAVVSEALEKSGLEPKRLQLEITESVLMADNTSTRATLQKIRSMGVAIALDDFGTCFSSLSYLKTFTFDKIKIDRSFVSDLPERQDSLAIVKAISELARDLGIMTVAEGVETMANLQAIIDAGCSQAQGFYFSPAIPNSAVKRVISQCNAKMRG